MYSKLINFTLKRFQFVYSMLSLHIYRHCIFSWISTRDFILLFLVLCKVSEYLEKSYINDMYSEYTIKNQVQQRMWALSLVRGTAAAGVHRGHCSFSDTLNLFQCVVGLLSTPRSLEEWMLLRAPGPGRPVCTRLAPSVGGL